jgi:hypothetical protein
MKTMPETVQEARARVADKKIQLDNLKTNIKAAEQAVMDAETRLGQAIIEQERANELGRRALTHCHGGDKQHEFTLLTMKDVQAPDTWDSVFDHFEYDRDYDIVDYDGWGRHHISPRRTGRAVYRDVRVPGKVTRQGSLECAKCGAKVELTNA